jgi:hypothetical protein
MTDNRRIESLKKILRNEFIDNAEEVWTNFRDVAINSRLRLKFEIKKKHEKKYLASVNYRRIETPVSINRYLLRIPREATVIAREDLFEKDKDFIKKILKHEAIHLGIAGHGQKFEEVANKVGTFSTENLISGGGYMVQEKIGKRFKTVKTFNDKNEAWSYARVLAKINKRVRLQY